MLGALEAGNLVMIPFNTAPVFSEWATKLSNNWDAAVQLVGMGLHDLVDIAEGKRMNRYLLNNIIATNKP